MLPAVQTVLNCMSWITERLEAKKKLAEAERERIREAAQENQRLANLAPKAWHGFGDVLQRNVEEFNTIGSRRATIRRTEQRIEVAWDGDLAVLAALDFNAQNRMITYICPVQRPNTGNPRRGEYRIFLDEGRHPYLFGQTLRGRERVGRVEPEEAAEAILGPVLFEE